jgi:HTH-type transcriptional regulator/antitoxin MqsA
LSQSRKALFSRVCPHKVYLVRRTQPVNAAFITSVRKKLELDQREAAELFSSGVNAFSRDENGKTKPPLALIKLLKVLDRHPDLLAEVRAASGCTSKLSGR